MEIIDKRIDKEVERLDTKIDKSKEEIKDLTRGLKVSTKGLIT